MALVNFTTSKQYLEPVIIKGDKKQIMDIAKKALKDHKRAIDELQ